MKILFPYDGHEHLGIGSLAAMARAAGHTPLLVRVPVGDYITGVGVPGRGKRQKTVENILDQKPDVVAFSLVSPTAGVMMDYARAVRASGIPTLAGGPHASAEPERTLKLGDFDCLVRGEAELVFEEMLQFVTSSIPVPDWLDTASHQATQPPPLPDLDTLPLPAKDIFYALHPEQASDYLISTSRGCPFSCSYCAGARKPGGTAPRRRSPASVIDELIFACEQHHPKSIYFIDDLFTLSCSYLEQFLTRYRAKVGIPFHCITHPSCLDRELALLLRDAGCFSLRIGVQTLQSDSRKLLGRHESDAQVAHALDSCKAAGIRVEVDQMVNIPGESPEQAAQAAQFYLDHRPDAIKVYYLTPLPGSAFMEQALELGAVTPVEAENLRNGKGYGRHSYLFYASPRGRHFLGVHLLLAYLPHVPTWWTKLLLKLKIYRFLKLPSFPLLVGGSRLLAVFRGWDRVGEGHLRRLFHFKQQSLEKAKPEGHVTQ